MMKSPMPDALPQLVPYVLVNNVAAATEKAKSLGARSLPVLPKFPAWEATVCSSIRPAGPLRSGSGKCPHRVSGCLSPDSRYGLFSISPVSGCCVATTVTSLSIR